MEKSYKVIGIMSGSSLDGVDLAYCHFILNNGQWKYQIIKADTIPYDKTWQLRLSNIDFQPAVNFTKTDFFYGVYLGKLVQDFIRLHHLQVDFVASHGHTIYHQPENGFTVQIGKGAAIHANCNLPVINDFRSLDVALHGQGAPLVSIVDDLLFPEFDYCLNLGGIVNISFKKNNERIAFDICTVNILLNFLSEIFHVSYDDKGEFAAKGKVNNDLLGVFNAIPYYKSGYPKTMGKEFFQKHIKPIVKMSHISQEDKLRTSCEHIAIQIRNTISENNIGGQPHKVLITGGGVFNDFLISRIKCLSAEINVECVIPEKTIVKFKEAMAFAFLGVLRVRNEINCLKSVTGAERDNSGGGIWGHISC